MDKDLPADGGPGDGDARRPPPAVGPPPVEVALLDEAGVIAWVNEAWNEFCRENGGDPDRAGPGVSYLALCDAAAPDDATSARVAESIRAALGGELPAPARITVPCPAPGRPRDFDVLISSRLDDTGSTCGATITLSATTAAVPAHRPPTLPEPSVVEELWVAGLQLQATRRAGGPVHLDAVIDQLDECIDRLRRDTGG